MYFVAIVDYVAMYLLFYYILFIAFNIVQIPFAVIHRYAVNVVYFIFAYWHCLFFAVTSYAFGKSTGLSEVPLLIVFSLVLFLSFINKSTNMPVRQNAERSINLHFYAALLSVPCLLLLRFLNISVLYQPIAWYMTFFDWLRNIPIIGKIVLWILRAASAWFVFSTLIGTITYIAVLFKKSTLKI